MPGSRGLGDAAEVSPELERWNTRFGEHEYLFGTRPNAFLAGQAFRLRPGLRVLCVADGEGRNSVWLAQQGLRVTAFDFSPVGLEKARALATAVGVTVDYAQADIAHWDWDAARFDAVVAICIQFAGPALRERIFAGMAHALAPGGLLLLHGYRPGQIAYGTGGPKQAENLYTEALLRQSFAALEILHVEARDVLVDEGPGHRGMSAVIDFVARRPSAERSAATAIAHD